jgi:excinuclease ABC subunit B
MNHAIEETTRRRNLQLDYNQKHGIDPKPLRKRISDISQLLAEEQGELEVLASRSSRLKKQTEITRFEDLVELVTELTSQMRVAAEELQFEIAASLRDEITELKREIRTLQAAGLAETEKPIKEKQ